LIITDFAGNGSLRRFLVSDDQQDLRRPNLISTIIASIALAMGLDSRGANHCDLKLDNIFQE
jgi:hypothetical protein